MSETRIRELLNAGVGLRAAVAIARNETEQADAIEEGGGEGASSHGGLTGVTADQHHGQAHAADHVAGEADGLTPEDIGALPASEVSAFGLTLIDDADATAARATLGVVASPTIIRGTVNGDGTIARGTGFSVNRAGTGDYTITWDTPFAAPPVVVASLSNFVAGSPSIAARDPADGAASATAIQVLIGVVGSSNADQEFSFIAIAV